MDSSHVNARKDGLKKESMQSMSMDIKLAENSSLDCPKSISNTLVSMVKVKHSLMLNAKLSQTSERRIKESFLRRTRGFSNRIPKHIVSLDEKYLRRCLEMIHINAAKAATRSILVNLSSFQMGIMSENFTSTKNRSRCTFDARFVIECPMAVGTADVVDNPAGQWIIGSITGNKSMINILKSPLFRQYGGVESDINLGRTSLTGIKGSLCPDHMSSPGRLSTYSSQELDKKRVALGNHNRLNSLASINSTCSDQSSSPISSSVSRGMLQCTWTGGIPHFVFSVDDQQEVYITNLLKVDSSDVEYTYLFHSSKSSQKQHEMRNNESQLVGKMNVSTSSMLCPNNSRVRETEFVLFGSNENPTGDLKSSSMQSRKNKTLSEKVGKVFKSGHSSKQRSNSTFIGTTTMLDYCPWEPCRETCNNLDVLDRSSLLDVNLPPNFELAAIVVKEHVPVNHQEAEVGGWGLKFLKEVGLRQSSQETSVPSECCLRNMGECSTSMDFIVPAGFHGGPRTRNGGPSSLIERWRSGGVCDCGGWDIGCPLTVLKSRASKEEFPLQADKQGECKSFDLFKQGIEQRAPSLKMVNIREDLYVIYYQSTLSALQSFSIAVALIHTQNPQFQFKSVQELK